VAISSTTASNNNDRPFVGDQLSVGLGHVEGQTKRHYGNGGGCKTVKDGQRVAVAVAVDVAITVDCCCCCCCCCCCRCCCRCNRCRSLLLLSGQRVPSVISNFYLQTVFCADGIWCGFQSVCAHRRSVNSRSRLPGIEEKLTAKQLNQAFHDGMPQSWQDRYANAGRSIATDNHANIQSFFCKHMQWQCQRC
jgi:hypothetical protein